MKQPWRSGAFRHAFLGVLILGAAGCAATSDVPSGEVPEDTPEDVQRRETGEALLAEAEIHLERGELDEASRALEQAALYLPEASRTAYLRGRLALARKDPVSAIPDLRRAWETDPEDDRYRHALREALIASGEIFYRDEAYDRAWEVLAEADRLEETPHLDYLRGLVAYAWARTTETDDRWDHLLRAEAAFRSVLEEEDDDDARFNLGAVLLALEEYEEAIVIYRELLERNPTDGGLYLALSRAHGMSGDTEAALAEEAVGKALRAGEPVDNPALWASRAADRFPESDLASTHRERSTPDAIYTYTVPGGSLVEVWFYRSDRRVEAFREGARIGSAIPLAEGASLQR